MIVQRRRAHRRTWSALAIVMPFLFGSFLTVLPDYVGDTRPPERLRDALRSSLPGGTSLGRRATVGDGAFAIELSRQEIDEEVRLWLRLEPQQALLRPDVLVYLAQPGAKDLDGADYLGTLHGTDPRTLPFPLEAAGRRRELLFYSHGYSEVVARVGLEAAWSATSTVAGGAR